jgi:hypothetical protein
VALFGPNRRNDRGESPKGVSHGTVADQNFQPNRTFRGTSAWAPADAGWCRLQASGAVAAGHDFIQTEKFRDSNILTNYFIALPEARMRVVRPLWPGRDKASQPQSNH